LRAQFGTVTGFAAGVIAPCASIPAVANFKEGAAKLPSAAFAPKPAARTHDKATAPTDQRNRFMEGSRGAGRIGCTEY
jgi:hypothetical protein